MFLCSIAKFLNLSMEAVDNLVLYMVEHDALKSLLLLTHVVLMWIVEKVELYHLVNELKKTPSRQDFESHTIF